MAHAMGGKVAAQLPTEIASRFVLPGYLQQIQSLSLPHTEVRWHGKPNQQWSRI
jgi:hypothetical protein